jgi:hypothetical protein
VVPGAGVEPLAPVPEDCAKPADESARSAAAVAAVIAFNIMTMVSWRLRELRVG